MLLLVVIYLAFISLGLPDSLLGAAWPTMRVSFSAPLEAAGPLGMVCTAGTIVSSLISTRLIRRYGTARVTLVSVAATALSLIGYALSPQVWMLYLFAIPLGLGGGSVDAALNNYVAVHYEAKHMSWLHCFWGLGATLGPMILSGMMLLGGQWRDGYWVIIILQCLLVCALAASQRMWRRAEGRVPGDEDRQAAAMTNMQALRVQGVPMAMLTFFCYCAAECSMILWTASFLTEARLMTAEEGAFGASLFFLGITVGRGLCGAVGSRVPGRKLNRLGAGMMLLGCMLMLLVRVPWAVFASVLLTGLGCAPIYPCNIHETPRRFGVAASQAATGLQMASAYAGSTLMPPLLGLLAAKTGLDALPLWVAALTCAMLIANERANRFQAQDAPAHKA